MWPYNECEWNYITHGKKPKKKNDNWLLVALSLLPYAVAISTLIYYFI